MRAFVAWFKRNFRGCDHAWTFVHRVNSYWRPSDKMPYAMHDVYRCEKCLKTRRSTL